jgi:hypothetical protein
MAKLMPNELEDTFFEYGFICHRIFALPGVRVCQ